MSLQIILLRFSFTQLALGTSVFNMRNGNVLSHHENLQKQRVSAFSVHHFAVLSLPVFS